MPCLAIRNRIASMTSLAMQHLKAWLAASAVLILTALISGIFSETFSGISLAADEGAEGEAAVL